MKRRPEWRRDYYDDTLSFCLEDGTPLVQGSVPLGQTMSDEQATAILSEPSVLAGGQTASENPTRPFIHTAAEPQKKLGVACRQLKIEWTLFSRR